MVFIQPSVVNNDRSLNAVQTDMDSRYKVSPRFRDFADGHGVLPPVDAIPPVEDKGKAQPLQCKADASAPAESGTPP